MDQIDLIVALRAMFRGEESAARAELPVYFVQSFPATSAAVGRSCDRIASQK
jgi:hypothetical protein